MSAPLYLRPAAFDALPGIVAGFSTRHGGTSPAPYTSLNLGLATDDDEARVQENRRRLFEAVGFRADQVAMAGQIHGAAVKVVTEGGIYSGYDALVTDTPGLLLAISAADCAAVLLADAEARVVAASHAGWRGTVARIVPHTVAAMVERGAAPRRLRAYISPCISAHHFEVGPEVAQQFDSAFIHHVSGKDKPHIDLKAAIGAQLEESGVSPSRIDVSPHCTVTEVDTFYSHRAERGRTGRMMGFVGMLEAA